MLVEQLCDLYFLQIEEDNIDLLAYLFFKNLVKTQIKYKTCGSFMELFENLYRCYKKKISFFQGKVRLG